MLNSTRHRLPVLGRTTPKYTCDTRELFYGSSTARAGAFQTATLLLQRSKWRLWLVACVALVL